MGVTGLWRLIEPSGKPVPLETLENKVLAVDISIWLHQAIKGFQDSKGAPLPNAHLLGIYHRVCKLLYFRIKPVFVFDGGVPNLKKQTIAKRNQTKSKNLNEADSIQKQLINTLLKHSAINKVIAEKAKEKLETSSKPSTSKVSTRAEKDDIFKLPEIDNDFSISPNDDEESESTDSSPTKHWDIHTIDEKSPHFQSLPPDVRHEILTELKETRKQSSWDRIHEIPKESRDFSGYQMKRLLKRFSIQACLEEAEKEMGGHSLSLTELESLLQDQGVVSKDIGQRIASDENTRFLLIKDIKKTIEEAKKQEEKNKKKIESENVEQPSTSNSENNPVSNLPNYEDSELQMAIQLSLQCEAEEEKPKENENKDIQKAIQLSLQSLSNVSQDKTKDSLKINNALFQVSSDSEEEIKPSSKRNLYPAKNYMMEYSGLTPNEIEKIIGSNTTKVKQIVNTNSISHKSKNEKLNSQETIFNTTGTISELTKANDDNNFAVFPKKLDSNIKQVDKAEEIELMSDSDSSEDLLEVPITEESFISTKTSGSSFEVTIQPSELLHDDLFSDIFSKSAVTDINTPIKSYSQSVITKSTLPPIPEEIDGIKNCANETISRRTESIILSEKIENIPNEELTKENVTTIKSDANISEYNKSTNLTKENNKQKVVKELLQTLKKSNAIHRNENDTPEKTVNFLDTNQLKEIQENLVEEQNQLISEKSSKERLATNITDQMYQEAQELLQLFGVPYIIAPMEAEAQCAFLDLIDLTDGTITDDSDIWLFGGKTVYKNFFNQNKYVLEFKSEDIEHHFKLTREQMVLLALLVGSDYTVGIQGIGPVTALEILAAFPPQKVTEFSLSHQQLLSGLSEFRSWLTGGKSMQGKTILRNKLKNVVFTENFPSYQVVQAYLDPTVDTNKEPFSWAKPDIVALTDFAKDKFGWTRLKSEEILKPVIKRMEEKHIQKSIREYFKTKYKLHSTEAEAKMSKRVQKAIQKIGTEPVDSLDEDQTSKKRTRKKKNDSATKNDKSGNIKKSKFNKPVEIEENISEQDPDFAEKPKRAKTSKISDNLSVPKGNQKVRKESAVKISKIKESQKTEKNDETNKKISTLSENSENTNTKSSSKKSSTKPVSKSTWSLSAPATEEINKVQQSHSDPKDLEINDADRISVINELNETDSNEISSSVITQPSTSTEIVPKRPKNTLKNNKKQKIDVDEVDEEMMILRDTITRSKSKIEQIRSHLTDQLRGNTRGIKEPREIIRDVSGPISPLDRLKIENIHKKEVIPQKVHDNLTMMRSKMKAIDVLKTKRNATKKRQKTRTMTHIGTHYLSESSSDEDIKRLK